MAARKPAAKKKAAPKKAAPKKAAKKAAPKKVAAKKAAPKKAAKKAAPKKVAAKKPAAKKVTGVKDRFTKTQIVTTVAENADLSKKQVDAVLNELGTIIERHIKKGACGEFVLPGLLKVTTVKKPARKARKGINPFTGEATVFKARPASIQVKVRPLKRLKDMAG